MSKMHELKTWPEYFGKILDGTKTFDFRKNDRDFQIGDVLVLQEYDPMTREYTDRTTAVRVTSLFKDDCGLPEGYVILSIVRTEAGKPVLQPWVQDLNFMQQSVLLAAIRGPDGIHKNHIAKVLQRWYRRCILVSAFEGKIMTDPYAGGGGSFTGPLRLEHLPGLQPKSVIQNSDYETISHDEKSMIGEAVRRYIKTLDELPHHYQLHFMHAAEIIGYKHPDTIIRQWWARTYEILTQDMHLNPETEAQMDYRLADKEDQWRKSEVVRAE